MIGGRMPCSDHMTALSCDRWLAWHVLPVSFLMYSLLTYQLLGVGFCLDGQRERSQEPCLQLEAVELHQAAAWTCFGWLWCAPDLALVNQSI